jgi:hypothetical protein
MFFAALARWIQQRRALRTHGYSFAQLLRCGAHRIEQLCRPHPQPARSTSGGFDRRDLRARW